MRQRGDGVAMLGVGPSGPGRILVAVISATALVAVACGNRTDRSEASGGLARDADGTTSSAPVSAPVGEGAAESPLRGSSASPSSVAPTGSAAARAGESPSASSRPVTGTRSSVGSARAVSGPAGPAPAGNVGSGTRGNEPTPGAPGPGGSGGLAVPVPGEVAGTSPVLLAHVGTLSGPAGGITSSSLLAQQVWVKSINQKGGLNGHPVKLFVYDDGGDPARHRAQVQEAIEQRRIIAFLGNTEVLTGQGSVEYITTKRIPVVGSGDGSATWFYESPMYFPQATVGMHYYFGALASIAQQVVPTGKTKLATFTCVEVEDCATADRVWSENAEDMGFTLVYRARASLGQPDYTAECLAARNAGADVAMIGIDTNSFSRIAVSCARQAYRPLYASLGSIVDDRFKDDPNFDGLVAAHPVFPYFQSGTPATDEFQRAMRAYGGGAPHTSAATTGWVAAKLLEKAAANLPEPPTTEALLKGLWSLRSDDLGGLTQPLTFVENQRTPPKWCMFNFTIKNRTWLSTDGFELRCRNNGPK